jgi:hypothetical protein
MTEQMVMVLEAVEAVVLVLSVVATQVERVLHPQLLGLL